MIVAVTGLAREARLIAHPDVVPVTGGGNAAALQKRVEAAIGNGGRRILSIGICGALCPELRVGDVVIASEVVTEREVYPTHASWTRELAVRLPHAAMVPMAGVDLVSADRQNKA